MVQASFLEMGEPASLEVSSRRLAVARAVRVVVMLCVASACVLAFLGLALALVKLEARSDRNAAFSQLERDYGFADTSPRVRSHRRVIEIARATMAHEDSYRVVVGHRWKPLWDVDWQGARGRDVEVDFLRFFLLPRRQLESAPWIFCLGCESRMLGPAFVALASAPDGFAFGRTSR